MVQRTQKPLKIHKRKTSTVDSHKLRRSGKYAIEDYIGNTGRVADTAMLDDDEPIEYAFYDLQEELDLLADDASEYFST